MQRISFIGLSFLLVFSIVRLLTAQKKITAHQKPVYKSVVIRSIVPRGYSPTAYRLSAGYINISLEMLIKDFDCLWIVKYI